MKGILFLIILHFGILSNCKSQTINWEDTEWASDLKVMLTTFLSCSQSTPSNTPCNYFVGKALERIYAISDFTISGSNNYITANDIASYVESDDKWTLLGSATEQDVLNNAQGYANQGKAVIAVEYVSNGHGHVCLIISGNLSYSGTWNLNCPNSASFFLNMPTKSYVGQKLSYAFSDNSNVKIYGRNF